MPGGTRSNEEACVKRALCRAAADTVVLASSEKLATASPYRIVGVDEISGIVLPATTPAELYRPYEERDIALTFA